MTTLIALASFGIACASSQPRAEPERHAQVVNIETAQSSETADELEAPPRSVESGEDCTASDAGASSPEALAAFMEGRDALLKLRHAEALEAFRKAYRSSCADRFLFLIGMELEKTGDDAGALKAFREYQKKATSDIGQQRAREYIRCIEERSRSHETKSCLQQNLEAVPTQ